MAIKILIYGCDIGGANALGEVIEELLKNYCPHRIQLKIFSKDLGYKSWKKKDFPVEKAPKKSKIKKMVKWADIVFTATSYPPDIEIPLWQAAKTLSKPIVVLLDFWAHYIERFTDPTDGKLLWPDKIAVIDKMARRELINCKVPAERIEITGQPFLEKRIKDFSSSRISRKTGLEELNVMFISQPLHEMPGAKKWGYDEFKALGCIAEALNSLVGFDGLEPNLIIRTHPREKYKEIKNYMESLDLKFKWDFDKESNPDKTIARSSFVLGMSSMLLIEAALAGKTVASVQPGLASLDPFPFSRLGYCEKIGNSQVLEEYIVEKMEKRNKKCTKALNEFTRINLNSCERIIRILLSYEKK